MPSARARVGVRLELVGRYEPLDQAHRERLAVPDGPCGVEDVLRVGGAHEVHELADRVGAVDDAEPRRGDTELRALCGEAQVARHGDGHRTAHAEAEDHRDGRLRALSDGRVGCGRLGVVAERSRGVLAVLLELGDVGAGGERLSAGAAIDDGAHRIVLRQALGDPRDLGPGPSCSHQDVRHFVPSVAREPTPFAGPLRPPLRTWLPHALRRSSPVEDSTWTR